MTATMTTTGLAEEGGIRLFGPRGRHRKPRPRKVLLAAGGLALAAGALSLVRLTPDARHSAASVSSLRKYALTNCRRSSMAQRSFHGMRRRSSPRV